MVTLWELVSQKLEFRFRITMGKPKLRVTPAHILDITDPLPGRCVYDPHLLCSLERAAKRALSHIHVNEAFTCQLKTCDA